MSSLSFCGRHLSRFLCHVKKTPTFTFPGQQFYLFVRKASSSSSSGKAVVNTSAANQAKDVLLYRYENQRFFTLLNIFAVGQFVFWLFLSSSSMSLINVPVSPSPEGSKKQDEGGDAPFWRTVNLGQDKYKYGLFAASFLMGYGILFVSWTYILRSVRWIVLRKDGKTVSFVTYAPFTSSRTIDVPISSVSAAGSRTAGTTQMPIKVKGKRLYYLVDVRDGQFPQPRLFDQIVGLQRKF